jgi:hypothetical protein
MSTTLYVPTTREVAVAIRKAHPNLGTYAIASGEEWSPYAETWWSLPGAPTPILRQRTSWDGLDADRGRINERHEQWLCFEVPDTEDD